jgi:hypothetical protein
LCYSSVSGLSLFLVGELILSTLRLTLVRVSLRYSQGAPSGLNLSGYLPQGAACYSLVKLTVDLNLLALKLVASLCCPNRGLIYKNLFHND